MGGKPKSKSTSVSYSGSSNPAFQPAALAGVGSVNQVFNQAQPGLDLLTNTLQKDIVPAAQSNFNASSALAGQGRNYYSDVLSGKYMNGNPYIGNILSQIRDDVSNEVGSHFSTTGRYGSGAHQGVLAKQLANAEGQLLYGNYSDEMDRMGQAAGAGQAANTADLAGLLQAIGQGAEIPYTGSSSLANSLGALFSGGQEKSNSTQKGPSPIWGALGSAIGSAAAIASDRRLKTNIELIRREPDGLGWYSWNWKTDPDGEKVYGVIADEVKVLRPWAYVPNFRGDGFDGVNYAALKVAA